MEPKPFRAPAQNTPKHVVEDDAFPASQRRALRDREPEALALFYDCYFDRMYGYVRRMVGSEHLAEDLTQDVFMHVITNLGSYDPERALRPWVFTIATNKVRDFWRSRRHRTSQQEVSLELDPTGAWATSDSPRPEQKLVQSERSDLIAAAIEELPTSMRLTLVLRYYEGLSFEAIGKIIERNETAVRKRYSRALEELRNKLGGAFNPSGEGGSASREARP